MAERFERHRQPWRQDEIQKLHQLAAKGMSLKVLAKALTPDLGVTNYVNLTASPIDANTNNNRASVITEIRGIANLALGVTVNPNPALATSNLTYTLSVTNLGPWPATDVLLTNPVPAGLSYVEIEPGHFVACHLAE